MEEFLDYNGFCEKFNFWPPFTLYYGIVSGILANVNLIDNNFFHENQPYMPYFISILLKNIKGAGVFYDIFVKCKYERPKSEVKWENELNLDPEIGWWEKQNSLTRSFTNDITLRWFHYVYYIEYLALRHYYSKLDCLTQICVLSVMNILKLLLIFFIHVEYRLNYGQMYFIG